MSKNVLFLLLFLFFVFIVSYKASAHIQNFFLALADITKTTYIDTYESIESGIDKHYHQTRQIEALTHEVEKFKKESILYKYYRNELLTVKKDLAIKPKTNTMLVPARTISYVTMGDYKKIWLDFDPKEENRIYGILQNQYVAGIITPKNGRSLTMLNGAEKCSYSVYIGKNKTPGIVNGGGKEDKIIVDFIPSWIKINKGDEVVTSGLDNIFFEGLPVGKIIEITGEGGYQRATLEPYADAEHPGYFWVIE